jgi:hypothetical protein
MRTVASTPTKAIGDAGQGCPPAEDRCPPEEDRCPPTPVSDSRVDGAIRSPADARHFSDRCRFSGRWQTNSLCLNRLERIGRRNCRKWFCIPETGNIV